MQQRRRPKLSCRNRHRSDNIRSTRQIGWDIHDTVHIMVHTRYIQEELVDAAGLLECALSPLRRLTLRPGVVAPSDHHERKQ